MLLHLSDVSSEPLHGQISRQIRAMILAGDLREGEALPSIRAMAREQHVSVITIQRAYDDLNREGLINSRIGKGFFVASLTEKQKRKMAMDRAADDLAPILRHALAAGLSPEEIAQAVRRILDHEGDKR
jgi:GntR family transcriptional regulator